MRGFNDFNCEKMYLQFGGKEYVSVPMRGFNDFNIYKELKTMTLTEGFRPHAGF